MADLTSIVRILGSIGGRSINFSHTYTLEDVYDVVQTSADQASTTGSIANADDGGEANVPQAGFDYLFFRNNSPQHFSGINLVATSETAGLICSPNQFGIMCSNATGEFFGTGGTLINVESVSAVNITNACGGSVSILAAYNAST
jgi:hypothetical protein